MMNHPRRWTLPAAASLLLAFAQSLPAYDLSRSDKEEIDRCTANLEPDRLRPDVAAACITFIHDKGQQVLTALEKSSPETARRLIAGNNALKYLGELAGDPEVGEREIAAHLKDALAPPFTGVCTLCSLSLGPRPESILAWTERLEKEKVFPEGRQAVVAASIRAWNMLEPAFQAKHHQPAWEALDIKTRRIQYQGWAKERLAEILQGKPGSLDDETLRGSLAIRGVLSTDDTARLDGFLIKSGATPERMQAASGKMDGVKGLSSLSMQDQISSLTKAFDGKATSPVVDAAPKPASSPAAPAGAMLTDDQARLLSDKLAAPIEAELKGTVAGDKLLAFYEDKSIDPKFREKPFALKRYKDNPNMMGLWDTSGSPSMSFSLGHVEEWMAKRGLSAEKLANDESALASLARYLAPIRVHEGTHQRQTAWNATNGLPPSADSNSVEVEVEAASMGALFVMEKNNARGDSYLAEVSELDLHLLNIFKGKGVRGLRRRQTVTYFDAGVAAKSPFSKEVADSFGSDALKHNIEDVAYARKNNPSFKMLPKLTSSVNNQFESYRKLYKKTAEDEAWVTETRSKLMAQGGMR